MQIYHFQSSYNIVMYIIYGLLAVLLSVAAFVLLRFWIGQIKAYRQSGERLPHRLTAFFTVISVVPIFGALFFGNMLVENAFYDFQMKQGNTYYLEGDIEVVSRESHYYRDTFLGYRVILTVDGETIAPSNTFSPEMIEYFEGDKRSMIQYGEIVNDGVYIWSISTVDD